MRKITTILIMIAVVSTTGFAQTPPSFTDLETSVEVFADTMASALPFASTIGLNWSDAYIGNFPHFGVGATVGVVNMPLSGFEAVLSSLGEGQTAFIDEIRGAGEQFGLPFPVGFPFPVAGAEARIGGLFLPFDIGVKIGLIPEDVNVAQYLPDGMGIDYLSFGADVRFRVVEETFLIPEVSVGGGMNYLRGAVTMSQGSVLQLENFEVPDANDPTTTHNYTLNLTDPVIGFDWETTVIDLKAQLSKRLLIFTPYIGAGATYGRSRAGGGITADLSLTGEEDAPLLDPEDVNPILEDASLPTIPDLGPQGFGLYSTVDGFAARAFAGLSIDLLFLRTDVTLLYEFASATIAASANVRLQF